METIDLVGARSPEPLSLLNTLTIRGSGLEQEEFSGQQVLELLGSAPNLIECTFQDLRPVSEYEIQTTAPKLVLLNLRQMMFGGTTERPGGDACILKFLTLPALQTLRLSLVHFSYDELRLFLRRSSPPLKELTLDSAHRPILIECLHLVPTLQHFEVWSMRSDLLGDLLVALANSSSFLPDLHTFRIFRLQFAAGGINLDSVWRSFLLALSSRPKLQTVYVEVGAYNTSPMPSWDIVAAFRELAKNGMQIYIDFTGMGSNSVSV
ncbi:hypothetical protein DFH06DRAFT_1314629 [Mycena polygramma]|nr:hypothetical protein DFH06DRAFT_1314629 [Mycena polygramma]